MRVCSVERDAHVAGQAGPHSRLDERLREEEDVGGTRPRHTRHRIEQRLVDSNHRADRREDRLGPREVGVGGSAPARDCGGARTDQCGCVRHRSHDRGTGGEAGLEAARGHAGRDRQHRAAHPAPASAAHAAATSSGFTATTAASAGPTASRTATPGNWARRTSRRSGTTSTTASSSGVAHPAVSRPPSSASPIRPPPTRSSRAVTAPEIRGAGCAGPEGALTHRTSPNQ